MAKTSQNSGMQRPFQQSLSEGHAAEHAWVEQQRAHGLSVAHGVRVVAEKFNPRKDHLQHPDAGGVFRIEIKNRGIRFTCKEDYPYPTVFLANMSIQSKDLTAPLIYVLRSEPTGEWLWVISTDRDESWKTGSKWDRTRSMSVNILECPKRFLRPPEELRKLLMHHDVLELLDGRTCAFGGGDRCSPEGDRTTDKRKRGTQEEADKCLGTKLKNCKTKSQPFGRQSKRSGR